MNFSPSLQENWFFYHLVSPQDNERCPGFSSKKERSLHHKSGRADGFCSILLFIEKLKKGDYSLLQRECDFLFQGEKSRKVV